MKRLILLLAIQLMVNSVFSDNYDSKQDRLKWWQDARFGMFIHWGPVSRIGKEISWSRENYGKARYDSLYLGFNPVKFNPEQWVETAKTAGMKYMVFTAKHHDGFACGTIAVRRQLQVPLVSFCTIRQQPSTIIQRHTGN